MLIIIILLLFSTNITYSKQIPDEKPKNLYNYAKQNNNLKTVKETLTLIINKYPHYHNIDKVIDELATIYLITKKLDKSYHYYTLLLKHNSPLKGKALYSLSKILILKKNYKKARKLINSNIKNLKKDDYFFKLVYLNGEIRFYEGNYQKAISLFKYIKDKIKPLKKEEKSIKPRLLLKLGQSHFYQKKYKKTKQYFATLIKEFPATLEARFAKNWNANLEKYSQLKVKDSFFAPFLVQVGAFTKHKNALIMQNKIKKIKLYSITISSQKQNKPIYKVIVPVESKNKANYIIKQLKQNNINAIIIKK